MKSKLFYCVVSALLTFFSNYAQGKKYLVLPNKKPSDNIVMTWNKNTPETEMNDDIKAIKEHGVIISYSDVKRNAKGEITAIKVDYADKGGSKGSMTLDNQKPINTIKFYKQDDEVGFGEPSGSDFISGNALANGFNPNGMMKGFSFNDDKDSLPGNQYHFEFPNGNAFGQSNSKTIIQKDGKKPLVLENGNVVEGGDDYTKEELDDIKKNNKVEFYNGNEVPHFDFGQSNGMGNLAEQMKKMQDQMNELMNQQSLVKPNKASKAKSKSDLDNTKEEMLKAKEEMQKAKEEMENAKKELEKAKSALKTQKA
jgi:hypothetical protein